MKAWWLGLGLVLAVAAVGKPGKYDPDRYAKAGPKPKGWVDWGYYGNPMGVVEYRTYDELVWPVKRMLYQRRPISQARFDSLEARIPKHGVFAVNLGNTKKGPVHRLSFRPAKKDSTELGFCDASRHVPGLAKGGYTGFQHSFKPEAGSTVFECPMPFAPKDSFFVHAVTKEGVPLFRTKFYPSQY